MRFLLLLLLLLRLLLRLLSRHVFISYSTQDRVLADQIDEKLAADGFRVWIDLNSIPTGTVLSDEIRRGIRRAMCVVILVSDSSVKSKWVEEEVLYAIAQRKRILVHKLGPVTMPAWLAVLNPIQRSATSEKTLGCLRRWRTIELAKTIAVTAVFAIGIALLSMSARTPENDCWVEIGSDRLPVEIYADGEHLSTLSSKVSHKTFRLPAGKHVIVARNEEWYAEKPVQIQDGGDHSIVWFDDVDFHRPKSSTN